jgi:hypothetical protein
MHHTMLLAAGLAMGFVSLQVSDQPPRPDRRIGRAADQRLDPELCAFRRGGFTLSSKNHYFPLAVDSWWLLEGKEDEARIRARITVLDETTEVGGVLTRVVEEREWAGDALTEVSRNFFAEAPDGTVCYFGEDVDIYRNGQVVAHEGGWRADAPGNRPGIIMPADPRPGLIFQMEGAPGVAEDEGKVVRGRPVRVRAGSFTATIGVVEFSPRGGGKDVKVFAKDVGIVVDGPLSLVARQQGKAQRGKRSGS